MQNLAAAMQAQWKKFSDAQRAYLRGVERELQERSDEEGCHSVMAELKRTSIFLGWDR